MKPSCPRPHPDFILHILPPGWGHPSPWPHVQSPPFPVLWHRGSIAPSDKSPLSSRPMAHPSTPSASSGSWVLNDIPGKNVPAEDSTHWQAFWNAVNAGVPFYSADPGLHGWLPTSPLPKRCVLMSPHGSHTCRANCAYRAV